MKKLTIAYWILTILGGGLMLLSGIPNALVVQPAVELVTNHLGYPRYFIPYIGVAKILGAIAIVVPGFPRIKEWAYAGLLFDLFSAIYSSIAVGDPVVNSLPILLPIAVLFASYLLYHRRLELTKSTGHD